MFRYEIYLDSRLAGVIYDEHTMAKIMWGLWYATDVQTVSYRRYVNMRKR